jgi:hypothetical protein
VVHRQQQDAFAGTDNQSGCPQQRRPAEVKSPFSLFASQTQDRCILSLLLQTLEIHQGKIELQQGLNGLIRLPAVDGDLGSQHLVAAQNLIEALLERDQVHHPCQADGNRAVV